VLVYHVFGYRKKVVRSNLRLAFPTYSEAELKRIEKASYKHMCDMFLEMMKTMSISRKEMEKRFVFKNMEDYYEIEKRGNSIALLLAHYASYEWVISMNSKLNIAGYAVYKRINNKYFDKLIQKIRARFNTTLIRTRDTTSVITANAIAGKRSVYGLISDQSPQLKAKVHWNTFMGVNVPVFTGGEFLARKYGMDVIYLKVTKVRRGYYEAEFQLITDDIRNVPKHQITEMFLRKVEQQIKEAPEYYLWTHKRWKHKDKMIQK
jgi:KDO2-lipid IV(A) lauroyltransferase